MKKGWLVGAHVLAGAVVVAAVAAEVLRPLAPDPGAPLPTSTWFDAAYLDLVADYRGPLRVVVLARQVLLIAVPLVFAVTAWGRRLVQRAAGGSASRGHRGRAAARVALAVGLVTVLVVLPLDSWAGFVHERAHGLSTQSLLGWLRDWAVSVGPGLLLLTAGAGVAWWVAGRLPRAWPPVLGLFGAVTVAVLAFAAPLVLEPLSFRFTPLPEGTVRAEVERVLAAAGEEVDAILVADASRRTTRANAYVSGLGGTRRVVLYDTLLAQRSPREIGAVLAHELGHRRHDDVARGALLGGAGAVLSCYVVALAVRRRPGAAAAGSVPAVLALLALLTLVGAPVATWTSRRAEAGADRFALDVTRDPATFASAIEELTRSNLGDPDPPRWVIALAGTHPTPRERLTMAERWP